MDYLIFALLTIGYILVFYLLVKIVPNKIWLKKSLLRLVVLSFLYALFLGFGFAGGGHFAFPAPVVFALFFTSSDIKVGGAILPLFFWWILIFICMLINWYIKRKKGVSI
jgi:hypothetical protein